MGASSRFQISRISPTLLNGTLRESAKRARPVLTQSGRFTAKRAGRCARGISRIRCSEGEISRGSRSSSSLFSVGRPVFRLPVKLYLDTGCQVALRARNAPDSSTREPRYILSECKPHASRFRSDCHTPIRLHSTERVYMQRRERGRPTRLHFTPS